MADIVTNIRSKSKTKFGEEIHAKMVESELIQSIVNHVVVQAATVVMMALRDTDGGPRSAAITASPRESQ